MGTNLFFHKKLNRLTKYSNSTLFPAGYIRPPLQRNFRTLYRLLTIKKLNRLNEVRIFHF